MEGLSKDDGVHLETPNKAREMLSEAEKALAELQAAVARITDRDRQEGFEDAIRNCRVKIEAFKENINEPTTVDRDGMLGNLLNEIKNLSDNAGEETETSTS